VYVSLYASPIGKITLAANERAVTGLWLEGQKYFGAGTELENASRTSTAVLMQAEAWLDGYFAGRCEPVSFPLEPKGTEFQKLVWQLLRQIPSGKTVTYGELAKQAAARLGKPSMSPQAVGSAVGRNPISVLIPCHRVVGADGSLTGYAGGTQRKRFLLRLEGVKTEWKE